MDWTTFKESHSDNILQQYHMDVKIKWYLQVSKH